MEPIWGFDLGGTKIEGVILKSKDERGWGERRGK